MSEPSDLGPIVAEMQRTLARAHLGSAPIPPSLAPDLRLWVPWCWSTREVDPLATYLFGEYAIEALLGEAPEYVTICHAGHGANSYALTYQVVKGPLAAFVQVLWGGIDVDEVAAAAEVRDRFDRLGRLVELAEGEPDDGPGVPNRIVLDSPFRGIGVCADILDPFDDEDEARRWLRAQPKSADPLAEALERWGRPATRIVSGRPARRRQR